MLYKIHDIDFMKGVNDSFETSNGNSVSFAQYYETKYNRKLNYSSQPLLIHYKRSRNPSKKWDEKAIYLIPELCYLTGQTPSMRANFNLQKDLNTVIKPNPYNRAEGSKKLINLLQSNKEISDSMNKWDYIIDSKPLSIVASKIDAGNLLMGNNSQISLEVTPDLDRQIQTEMLHQIQINKIGIFCTDDCVEVARTFCDTLKLSLETFQYKMSEPRIFKVGKGRDPSDWERTLKANLDPSVQAVVLILPGKKKNGTFYDECKKLLLTQCPVPSQVVLVSTIQEGKNLRSKVNKILIQLCAKVGGTPWSVTEFPFADKPTMIVGIDVFHNTKMGKDSVLAYCATMDRYFSRYWSTLERHKVGEEIGTKLQGIIRESILAFKTTNNRFPDRIIVYRDGVSESQRKTLMEVEAASFLRAIEALRENDGMTTKPDFVFICVNKTPSAKFYLEKDSRIENVPPGTSVASEITAGRDFYLVSQKVSQGTANPTHYCVLKYFEKVDHEHVDKTNNIPKDIIDKLQVLSYKLCYMYYNWTGAIKVPAPLAYAHKLAGLIGDRWKPHDPIIPHKHFETLKCLYFI